MARTSARGAVKDETWAKPAAQGRQAIEVDQEEERKRAARGPHGPKGQEEQAGRRGKGEPHPRAVSQPGKGKGATVGETEGRPSRTGPKGPNMQERVC